jgi:hypothetical protein
VTPDHGLIVDYACPGNLGNMHVGRSLPDHSVDCRLCGATLTFAALVDRPTWAVIRPYVIEEEPL